MLLHVGATELSYVHMGKSIKISKLVSPPEKDSPKANNSMSSNVIKSVH